MGTRVDRQPDRDESRSATREAETGAVSGVIVPVALKMRPSQRIVPVGGPRPFDGLRAVPSSVEGRSAARDSYAPRRTVSRLPLTLITGLLLPAVAAAQQATLPGGLQPGPHAVGFRVIALSDPSRPIGPKPRDAAAASDRARQLRLHVWYPAAASSGDVMTIGDYIRASEPVSGRTQFAAQHRQMVPRSLGVPFSDEDWSRYTALRLTARQDAPPASGRFPLLIGVLREVSVALMSEYFASHGYVVAFVQPPLAEQISAEGLVLEGLVIGQHVRDMEIAIPRLRSEPWVDPVRLGAVGFSGSGLAQLVLAMRHPDVDAVSQLETGYFAPIGTSSYQEVTAYDTTALRVPMFFAYSESLGRNTDMQMAEIDRMRYAPRHLLYLGEPRMGHWDFATEGVAAIELGKRADAKPGVLRAFNAIHKYHLAFFDTYVKRDAAAAARLAEAPPSGGGALIESRPMPAVLPAMTRREFRSLLLSDAPRAFAVAREGLARDPQAAVFDETWLNAVGYELMQTPQRAVGLDVFRLNIEAHPSSANAADSLSEALEEAGQRAPALEWAEKALKLLPADRRVPDAQRDGLQKALEARIARLRPR
jgi:hypothetical protein